MWLRRSPGDAGKGSKDKLTPGILAGLTLQVLAVTFRSWFDERQPDIAATADQVFATLGRSICEEKPGKQKNLKPAARGVKRK